MRILLFALAAMIVVGVSLAVGHEAGRRGFTLELSKAMSQFIDLADPAQSFDIQDPSASPQERRILYYRNPMGLPDTSPVPKKDSMGMDYIPVYADEVEDGNTVSVATSKVQRTGFSSISADRREVVTSLALPGIIAADERLQSVISARTEAFIQSVGDATTGSHVRKGEPLLTLRFYDDDIVSAASLYVASLRTYGLNPNKPHPEVKGFRQRLENLALPEEVIQQIEQSKKADLTMTWRAPRDALVLERNAVEGMRAMPGEPLFKLSDHSIVWVHADVPEANLSSVAVGQSATIRVRSLADRIFEGRVVLIYPEVSEITRTVRIRVELANLDGLLRPGMYADVEISASRREPQVAVPESAIIDSGSQQIVIIDKGEGKFEPRKVDLGRRGNGYAEILNGITEGEKVVTSAYFLIDAESNLRAALQGLTEPGTQP